jgi:hypothetical protein
MNGSKNAFLFSRSDSSPWFFIASHQIAHRWLVTA